MRKRFGLMCVIASGLLAAGPGYEVWMTDQNNTAGYNASVPRGTHGGRLAIYDSEDLDREDGPRDAPEILDFSVMFAANGPNNTTGAEVSRPHMIFQSPTHDYMVVAFVASGHVGIIDGATRRPKALFRMSVGAGGARQAHAAFWTSDGHSLIVANQNGKLLERINYNPDTDTFTHDTAATLNLATCRTPNGFPCESATPANADDRAYLGPHNRPDNAPICPITSSSGKVYVTLRGGGMFVVDASSTPMAIVAEYGNQAFGRDGCGGVESAGHVYLISGAGTMVTNPDQFMVYKSRDDYPNAPAFLPPNSDRLKFFAGDLSKGRDAHGVGITPGAHYIWIFDRTDVAEVYRLPTGKHVFSVDLKWSGVSPKPTPDLVALSPKGDRFYAALRGPKPQTGSPHVAMGETPGLGIVKLNAGGAWGTLTHVLRTRIPNPVDGSEESDPHGVTVRIK
jgi:hypothetical protein